MTSRLASVAVAKTVDRMTGEGGVSNVLGQLTNGEASSVIDRRDICSRNVAADVAERSGPMRYPAMNVFCERLVNDLKQKFRAFSGRAEMAVQIVHSEDRLEGMEPATELYADAMATMLDGMRGDWGDGMYYGGGYEVKFGPIKRGGKNFLQTATVTFALEVSR